MNCSNSATTEHEDLASDLHAFVDGKAHKNGAWLSHMIVKIFKKENTLCISTLCVHSFKKGENL